MSRTPKRKPGRPKKPEITPDQISGAKSLRNVFDLLRPLHSHRDRPNQDLHYDEFAFLLLYFFTPILAQLAHEVSAIVDHPRLDSLGLDIVGFDATLLHTLPKRVWALWLGDRATATAHATTSQP